MLNRNTGTEALTRFAAMIILARSVTSQTEKRISQRARAVTPRAPKLSVFEASRGNGRKLVAFRRWPNGRSPDCRIGHVEVGRVLLRRVSPLEYERDAERLPEARAK
jgi:hypothetical protein